MPFTASFQIILPFPSQIERRRREVAPTAEKSLEELFKSHLAWLTPAQKEELQAAQNQGMGRTEMQQKVMAWFGELAGEARAQALERLRDGFLGSFEFCTFWVPFEDAANCLFPCLANRMRMH